VTDLFGFSVNADPVFDIDFHAQRIYKVYPRHTARKAALRSIVKAIKANAKEGGVSLHDSALQLLHQTEMFANSPDVLEKLQLGKRKFICHPSTYFNQERYTDSDQENGYEDKLSDKGKDIRQDLIDLGLIKG